MSLVECVLYGSNNYNNNCICKLFVWLDNSLRLQFSVAIHKVMHLFRMQNIQRIYIQNTQPNCIAPHQIHSNSNCTKLPRTPTHSIRFRCLVCTILHLLCFRLPFRVLISYIEFQFSFSYQPHIYSTYTPTK